MTQRPADGADRAVRHPSRRRIVVRWRALAGRFGASRTDFCVRPELGGEARIVIRDDRHHRKRDHRGDRDLRQRRKQSDHGSRAADASAPACPHATDPTLITNRPCRPVESITAARRCCSQHFKLRRIPQGDCARATARLELHPGTVERARPSAEGGRPITWSGGQLLGAHGSRTARQEGDTTGPTAACVISRLRL
jgi:hypothetical protein